MSEPNPAVETAWSIHGADEAFADCDARAVQSCTRVAEAPTTPTTKSKSPARRPCVTEIRASIGGTHGLRDPKNKRPDKALRSSTSSDKSLKDNAPVVLVRGCKDVVLEAVTQPAGAAVTWNIEANETRNAPPSIQANGNKATLSTNVDGSFSVTASAGGCKVVWNVVFVWVKVDVSSSKITARDDMYADDEMFAGDAGVFKFTRVRSGQFKKGLYPWEATVQAELLGGGADRQLGQFKIEVYVLQNGVSETTTAHYKNKGTGAKKIDVSFPLLDTGKPDSPFLGLDMFELHSVSTPAGDPTRVEVFVGDAPTAVYLYRHEVTRDPLQTISGGTSFRAAIASVSRDAPDTITVHAEIEWSVDYKGVVDKNGTYTPKGAKTKSGKAFRLIADATGGMDAQAAKYETFGPRFLDFQEKVWSPSK